MLHLVRSFQAWRSWNIPSVEAVVVDPARVVAPARDLAVRSCFTVVYLLAFRDPPSDLNPSAFYPPIHASLYHILSSQLPPHSCGSDCLCTVIT
jgi:hypothetical protein